MLSKAKALVLLTFVAVFGAGAVSSLVVASYVPPRQPPSSPNNPGGPPSRQPWIPKVLGLNEEQSKKMQTIMSTAREENMERDRARRELQRKLQDDLIALLTPEQKAKHEEARLRTEQAIAKLREESDAAWKEADKKLNEILTPEQVTKWQELRSQQRDRGPRQGGGPGGPGGDRGGDRGPGGDRGFGGGDHGPGDRGPGGPMDGPPFRGGPRGDRGDRSQQPPTPPTTRP